MKKNLLTLLFLVVLCAGLKAQTITPSGSFTPFSTNQGVASAYQTFSVNGTGLVDDITVTAPTGMEVSQSGISYTPSIVLTQSGGTVSPGTLYLRVAASAIAGPISATLDFTSSGATAQTMPVSGTVGAPVPTILVSGSLSPYSTTQGTPSTSQQLYVSGVNLSGDINIVGPSSDIEFSTDGGITYSPSVTLTQSGGNVNQTTIDIRVSSTAVQGSVSGNVDMTSPGANAPSYTLSGSVNSAPTPVITTSLGSLPSFSTTEGTPSSTETFDVSGSDLTGDITITPPADVEISADGGSSYTSNPFVLTQSGGIVLLTTITVRIASTALSGTISNDINLSSPGAISFVSVFGTVNPPPSPNIIASVGGLSAFSTTAGVASAPETFDISGTNLTNDITITAPTYMEVSNDGGATYNPSLVLFQSGGTVNLTTISVRIASTAPVGTINSTVDATSPGASVASVTVSGTVNPAAPLISTTGSFTPFNTTSGTASTAQTFSVTGTNLVDDIDIIVPAGMEVSSDGISYISPGIVLIQSGGNVGPATVYLRISTSASGVINGTVDLTSNTATTVNIPVSGNVGPLPTINVTGVFSPFTTSQGTVSTDQIITVSGTDLLGNIVINNLPIGIEVSSDGGTTYNTSLTLPMSGGIVNSTSINVRVAASATAGTITGNVDVTSFNATTVSIPVSGTVNPPGPTFSVLPTTLTPISTVPGTPSATQTLTITGSNLVGQISFGNVPGLEFSSDGGVSYVPGPKFTPVGGNVNVTLLVRIGSSAPIGTFNNMVIITSPSAITQIVNARTSVTGLALTAAALPSFSTTAGTASANQVYFVNASGLTSTVLVTPPVGYEIAIDTNGAIYNPTAVLTPLGGILSNKRVAVRLASTAFGGSHVGTIVHSTPGITSQMLPVIGYVNFNCNSISTISAGNDTTFCGTSIQLTGGTLTPGFPYQWRIIGGTAIKVAPDTNAVKPFIVFPDAATTVTQQIELSVDPACPTKRDTIVITKTATGLPSANAGVDFQTAQNNNISIGNSGAGSITWSTSGTGSFASNTSAVTTYTPSTQDLSDGQVELVINALGTGSCAAYRAEDTVYVTLANSTFNLSGNLSNTASATSYRILLAHQMNDYWNVVKDSVFSTATYNFQGLSNGNYRVQAITNDGINIPTYFGNTVSWENSTVLNIANSNLTGKDIAMNSYALHPDTVAKYLSGQGRCAGRILLDLINKISTLRIATDASDLKPVQGATVNIYNSNGNTKLSSTTSDADGFYSVSGLTAQSYQIEVQYPGTVLTGTTVSNSSQLQPLASDGNPTTPVLKNVEVVKITQSAQNKLGAVTSIFQPSETEKTQEMILYPNPAKAKAAVKITLPDSWTGTTRVIVFDAQGKPVLSDDYTGNAEALLLKTENLLSGLYQISIHNGGRIQMKQLILE